MIESIDYFSRTWWYLYSRRNTLKPWVVVVVLLNRKCLYMPAFDYKSVFCRQSLHHQGKKRKTMATIIFSKWERHTHQTNESLACQTQCNWMSCKLSLTVYWLCATSNGFEDVSNDQTCGMTRNRWHPLLPLTFVSRGDTRYIAEGILQTRWYFSNAS